MSLENKIQIKNRMIKKAASLWGVSPNEIESSFDPVVALLISSCASEIAKISGEINNSQSRVTERLIQLMTPETLYGARPAHGIAYAEPSGRKTIITPEHLFYHKKRIKTNGAQRELKDIFFSPAQDYKLIGGKISHVLCGKDGYEIEGKAKNDIDFATIGNASLPASTLYLGIKTEQENISLKDASMFFELLDVQDKDLFYHHLKNATFYLGDQLLDVSSGYYDSEVADRKNLESLFSLKPSKTRNIENQVKKTYEKHFITIKTDISLGDKAEIPSEFTKFISLDDYDELGALSWIKIVFPRVIDTALLKGVYASFNAFPVLNRKLESVSYQLKDYIDIVPLSTMNLFLDIRTVSNTDGKSYKLRENDAEQDKKGTFVVRKDNIGKLDSRKAKEYLVHLIELLKDESAAFSVFGNDFLQSNINELNQNIAALEKKVSDMNKLDAETNYVSVKPYKNRDTLLIDYWTTNGEEANQIKSGSALQVYKGGDIKPKESIFLTPTFQGKNNLSMEERLYAYRRALLSRNRIVTKEDIKALCFELCNNKIENVNVRKTFRTDIEANKGLVPSLEVVMTASKGVKTSELEWSSIKSNILSILEEQSLNIFPYYITILN
ncbi:type VI secretion system baseplate subunit TssF [Aquimarina pacifica]|uniref:type VI secretion system baseplate subunit TssF n=1 Tax=Aquimarina pacifica TaxID=1296415 RepID=UPI00046E5B89|nr:type VI secretion system baseplate subunit TssF [Aquimarina pacifica]